MTGAAVIRDEAGLAPLIDAWDDLATRRRQPYSAPAWMLAWWRHLAPRDSRLAVVAVRDAGGDLVGLAPWYQMRGPGGLSLARLLGTGHRVEPLAAPGREDEVAAAVAAALGGLERGPRVLLLDRVDARSRWPDLLAGAMGPRATVRRERRVPAPTLATRGRSYEQWLAERSSNFRGQRARARRRLEAAGVTARLVGPDDDPATTAAALMRLHAARWSSMRRESSLAAGVEGMVRDAAAAMVPGGRMRVWLLERAGRPISAQLFVIGGGEAAYWNGGFDPAEAALRPGFEALAFAVEHAFRQGDARIDFGGGSSEYKDRLADADEPLGPALIICGGADRALTEARLLPGRLRAAAAEGVRRLPPPAQRRVRAAVDRLRGS
ncbi:MAG: GNAT family N-acetyltransferase [Thermoleophilia bacterium]